MNAEILSVGTELLLGDTVDTNAAYLSQCLAEIGVNVYRRATVGDNASRLTEAILLAKSRCDVLITIGGLGPTEDDITKETAAAALGTSLHRSEKHAKWLQQRTTANGRPAPAPSFFKQADIPSTGTALANDVGTALGCIFETPNFAVACLPGPPAEFKAMVQSGLLPYLCRRLSVRPTVLVSTTLRVTGIGESRVEEMLKDLLGSRNPTVAPYAKTTEVHLRLTARADRASAAKEAIRPVAAEIARRLGSHLYGVDDETLEHRIVSLLQRHHLTVSAAESCSGGAIAKRITSVPDSSKVFGLGLVTYSNEAKSRYLGVDSELIQEHGAVSTAVAEAMAVGARDAAGSDIAVSVTGIAGPGGGSPHKPVGTVCVGFASADGVRSETYHFLGGRAEVTERSAQAALTHIYQYLAGLPSGSHSVRTS